MSVTNFEKVVTEIATATNHDYENLGIQKKWEYTIEVHDGYSRGSRKWRVMGTYSRPSPRTGDTATLLNQVVPVEDFFKVWTHLAKIKTQLWTEYSQKQELRNKAQLGFELPPAPQTVPINGVLWPVEFVKWPLNKIPTEPYEVGYHCWCQSYDDEEYYDQRQGWWLFPDGHAEERFSPGGDPNWGNDPLTRVFPPATWTIESMMFKFGSMGGYMVVPLGD